ncbi:MAG: hypothetical protein HYU36_01125 [Planctomycetes bacterium]|nr:hypothetical protein [Planctomycetota bacterium]
MKTYPMLAWPIVHYGIKGYRKDGTSYLVDAPRGVHLVVPKADCSPPVFVPDRPWERGLFDYFRLVHEDGVYRLWYTGGSYQCYAESVDGNTWTRPDLGIVSYGGSTANNICFGGRGAACGYWFEDYSAEPSARYKYMMLAAWWVDKDGREVPESLVQDALTHRTGNELDPIGFRIISGMVGYVSPDRFHWRMLEVPSLMNLFSDNQPILWFDRQRGVYRGYFRTLWEGQRAVGYAETKDFTRWPLPEVVFHATAQDGLDTDIYASGYCPYPGNSELHLQFPALYHHIPDTVDIHLAVSRDGMDWGRPSFDPIIPLGERDGLPETSLYVCPDLVTLKDGRWGLLYNSVAWPHNAGPDYLPEGRCGTCYRWARWQPHRLAGVTAEAEGQFTIRPQPSQAGELRLNYKTEPGGWVRIELADRGGGYPPSEIRPWPGYSFAECDALAGDELDRTVAWRGSPALPVSIGQRLAIRVRLYRATVFAVAV